MKRNENYFERAREAVRRISAEQPGAVDELREKLERAREQAEAASDRLNKAETEDEFRRCYDADREAQALVRFYERQLDNLSITPRMDPSEYDEITGGIDAAVVDAARSFREVVTESMDRIIEATRKYTELLAEADEALISLDKAGNVLQARYADRAFTRVGMDTVYERDPYEWKRHTTRYGIGSYRSRGKQLALTDSKILQGYHAATNCKKGLGGKKDGTYKGAES